MRATCESRARAFFVKHEGFIFINDMFFCDVFAVSPAVRGVPLLEWLVKMTNPGRPRRDISPRRCFSRNFRIPGRKRVFDDFFPKNRCSSKRADFAEKRASKSSVRCLRDGKAIPARRPRAHCELPASGIQTGCALRAC